MNTRPPAQIPFLDLPAGTVTFLLTDIETPYGSCIACGRAVHPPLFPRRIGLSELPEKGAGGIRFKASHLFPSWLSVHPLETGAVPVRLLVRKALPRLEEMPVVR